MNGLASTKPEDDDDEDLVDDGVSDGVLPSPCGSCHARDRMSRPAATTLPG